MGRQQLVHLSTIIALATLANDVAIVGGTKIDASRDQGVRIKKLMVSKAIAVAPDTTEIPLIWGYAIALNAAEIAECLNADPQGIEDTDASDKANRKVYVCGNVRNAVPSNGSGAEDPGDKWEEVPVPWDIPEGSTFNWWVMNRTNSALSGGMIVHINAVAVTEWLRD